MQERTTRDAALRARILCITRLRGPAKALDELARTHGFHLVRVREMRDAFHEAHRDVFTIIALGSDVIEDPRVTALRAVTRDATNIALVDHGHVELPREPDAVSGVVRIADDSGAEDVLEAIGRAQLLWEARRVSSPIGVSARTPEVVDTEVMLVEDSVDDAEIITTFLQRSGVERVRLTRASRVDEALALLAERSFALILTDLTLPDARGVDAVAALRRAAPQTPIVVLSGLSDEATAMQSVAQGAQEYLLKSEISTDALRRTLRHAVGRKALEEQLAYQAHHDPLTGLANRALFRDRLDHAVAKAKRSGERLAVLFIDLDRFKQVNDTYGHEAGDALLGIVAERLEASIRGADTLARLGGDEFAVLTEGLGGRAAAIAVAERIDEALLQSCALPGDRVVEIAGSIGIAFFPEDGLTTDALVRNADTAMYRAKRRGRGGYVCYGDASTHEPNNGHSYEAELVRAVRTRTLGLSRRAIRALHDHAEIGVWLAPAWAPPGQPELTPARLARAIARSNLEDEVGRWLLASAAWLAARSDVPVWVRVGSSHFQHGRFSEDVARHVEVHRVPEGKLWLVVGQADVRVAPDRANAELARLSRAGIPTVLADFGAHGADLDIIRQLPAVRALLLDTEWCTELRQADDGAIFLQALAQVARARGIITVSPPDCSAHAGWLAAAGCQALVSSESARVVAP